MKTSIVTDAFSFLFSDMAKSQVTRRAGHHLSVEPDIKYTLKKTTLYVYVPAMVSPQNWPDKNATKIAVVYSVSPGGSGNYKVLDGSLLNYGHEYAGNQIFIKCSMVEKLFV